MLEGIKKAISSFKERMVTAPVSEKSVSEQLGAFRMNLISNDVAVEVADQITESMVKKLQLVRAPRFSAKDQVLMSVLKETLGEILTQAQPEEHLLQVVDRNAREGKTSVVLFVGPNGGGKTTTVIKIAHYLRKNGFSTLVAVSDTFRAGAIEQLTELAQKAKIRTVHRDYGADPASVAVDAIISARSSAAHVVLIDTAGRTEIDRNLLEEMKKIKRVTKPDLTIYVGDALTGNVAVEQARRFNEYVGVDAAILTKVDADAKGGSAVSIGFAIGKPVMFLGTGQDLDDLVEFNREWFLQKLLT